MHSTIASLICCIAGVTGVADGLDALLQQAEDGAQLYANIEVRYARDIAFHGIPKDAHPSSTILNRHTSFWAVWQGHAQYYCRMDDRLNLLDGSKKEIPSTFAFDGEAMRVNSQLIGNVGDARVICYPWAPPQLWGAGDFGECTVADLARFSAKARKLPKMERVQRVEPEILGAEEVDGVSCVKLACSIVAKAPRESVQRYVFWLAPARNYLAIKSEGFSSHGARFPIVVNETGDWRELVPSVWIPYRAVRKTFNDGAAGAMPALLSMETIEAESVRLDPGYDKAFFGDVEMPAQGTTYHLKGGRIVATEHPIVEQYAGDWRRWLWLIPINFAAALALYWWFHRRAAQAG